VKTSRVLLILVLLLSGGFSLATFLQPVASEWTGHSASDSLLKLVLGDARAMFARQFFVKADITFHSGFYPSVFDQARQAEETENHVAHPGEEGQKPEGSFLGPPTDWIDRFGRHFRITEHTHLEGGNIREILPWLRLSAEMDPHRIETYTTVAYWLRNRLGKVKEAEQFLREGLSANPNSAEILFELGRLEEENHHDVDRARNVWELALRKWRQYEAKQKQPNLFVLDEITIKLARLEEAAGHYERAIDYLEQAKEASPNPADLDRQIRELRTKLASPPAGRPADDR
jgi:tetratricopeptide (TPR) repeat protein